MAYLTVAELKTKEVIDSIKDCTEDSRLQFLLDYCTALIDAYVGFTFEKETGVVLYVDGEGTNKITLPKRICKITSISLTDGYIYSTSGLRIQGKRRNQLIHLFERFDDGCDNVELVGDFGWETVPTDIITCLIILCNGNFAYLADEDKLQQAMGPFKREVIGNYSYELKTSVNSVTGADIDSTGDKRVDQILEAYRADEFSIGVV